MSRDRITEILQDIDLADPAQAEELLSLVYAELRAIAARQLRRERNGHTLQPTALVHEAYLRLVQGPELEWEGRAHFFRIAARAMRQVLIDAARRRAAAIRGGAWRRVSLTPDIAAPESGDHDILDLHEILEQLGKLDSTLEQLVELRFFAGLTIEEAAGVLGISPRTAARNWAAARAWLQRELKAP